MILILSSFLVVVYNVVVHPKKPLDNSLFLATILTSGHGCCESMNDLETISEIVLDCCSTRFIVIHVENLSKILRSSIRSTISDKPKHYIVSVIFGFDIIIHPNLPNNVYRLNTKSLTNTMRYTTTTCNIGNA
ncbi:AC5 protein [Lycianthes yellow mosaic virus]|uniref:AC5 protein n=1 Tax=Lycianthes yellow mosaic virus TaxID=1779714 RepID=A0A140D6R3_9GEMI|nr:AC5 protein [Lycianthes yellow mosaic virus]AMK07579.1 AC5 protein [Lycianthes yellow mosaic virus]